MKPLRFAGVTGCERQDAATLRAMAEYVFEQSCELMSGFGACADLLPLDERSAAFSLFVRHGILDGQGPITAAQRAFFLLLLADMLESEAEPAGITLMRHAVNALGAEHAALLDERTLEHCRIDTNAEGCFVTADDLAVVRAALFVLTGSALLSGSAREQRAAVKRGDGYVLYELATRACNTLIGQPQA